MQDGTASLGVRMARGAVLVRADGSVLEDAAVAWRGRSLLAVGPWRALRRIHPDAPCEGGAGFVIVPGLVNAHQHGHGLTSLVGGVSDQPLEGWLLEGLGLPAPSDRAGILLSAARLLRSGTTTAVHLHACRRPADPERMRARLAAWRESGLSVAFASGFKSRHRFGLVDDASILAALPDALRDRVVKAFGPPPDLDYLGWRDWEEAVVGLGRELDPADDRVRLLAGPPGPEWCVPEDLEAVADVARREGLGVHVHVAESPLQARHAECSPDPAGLAALDAAGLLGPRTALVHAVHCSDADIDLIARRGCQVVTCPGSNLRLRHGVAPLRRLRARGIPVAVGTDSLGLGDRDDAWAEARLLLALHGRDGLEPGETAWDVGATWRAMTVEGARVAQMPGAGQLEPGARADFVLLDAASLLDPSDQWMADPATLVLGRARPEDVRLVVAAGREVLREGRILAFDEGAVREEARADIERATRDSAGRHLARDLAAAVARVHATRFGSLAGGKPRA